MKFAREYSKAFKVNGHFAVAFVAAKSDTLIVHYRGFVIDLPLEAEYEEETLFENILTNYKKLKRKKK